MRNEKQIHPLWRLHYGKNCSLAFPKNNKQWNIINCKPKTAMRTGKFFKRGESQGHVGRARITCEVSAEESRWPCAFLVQSSVVLQFKSLYIEVRHMLYTLVSTFSAAVHFPVGVGCLTGNLKHRGQTLYNISDLMVCTSHARRWFGCNFFFLPFDEASQKGLTRKQNLLHVLQHLSGKTV